jgi:acetyl-CoA carboxylase biotin carboxyl carrier protein
VTRPVETRPEHPKNGHTTAAGGLIAPAPAAGEDRPDATAMLDALRDAALRLLGEVHRPPSTLRIEAGQIAIELSWPESAPAAAASTAVPVVAAAAEAEPAGLDHVHAPTVGTFYRAPSPGAPPFVEEGAVVAPGRQVGIVEAMKLMIPVESDRHGKVVQILVADGSAVEFGQRLLAIAPQDPS